jgi:restriction endonuclease Mrr
MHAVIRTYSGRGAKELFDVLEQRNADVEAVMRPIKGFVSYTAARTGDGGVTVTVCQDKAGADESVAKARDWVAKNAASVGAAAPTVSEGPVIVHAK